MCFETRLVNGVKIAGHRGSLAGSSNQLEFYPDLGYVLVILGPARRAVIRTDGLHDGRLHAPDATARHEQPVRNSMSDRDAVTCLRVFATMLIAAVAVGAQPKTLAISGVNVVDVVNGRIGRC